MTIPGFSFTSMKQSQQNTQQVTLENLANFSFIPVTTIGSPGSSTSVIPELVGTATQGATQSASQTARLSDELDFRAAASVALPGGMSGPASLSGGSGIPIGSGIPSLATPMASQGAMTSSAGQNLTMPLIVAALAVVGFLAYKKFA